MKQIKPLISVFHSCSIYFSCPHQKRKKKKNYNQIRVLLWKKNPLIYDICCHCYFQGKVVDKTNQGTSTIYVAACSVEMKTSVGWHLYRFLFHVTKEPSDNTKFLFRKEKLQIFYLNAIHSIVFKNLWKQTKF